MGHSASCDMQKEQRYCRCSFFIQQFAEISNLSKLNPSLYLYGFEGLSFFGFCANEPKNDDVLNDYCNYITG